MRSNLTSLVPLSAAVICAFAVAACGGSSPTTANSASTGNSQVKFDNCMRSHGIPDFPDAGNGPTQIQANQNGNSGTVDVDGHQLQETPNEFNKAQQECAEYSPQNNDAPAISTSQLASIRAATLKMAKCMRAHGVTSFPDPKVSTGPGGKGVSIGIQSSAASGSGSGQINPNNPTFKSAQQVCMKIVTKALPGGAPSTRESG